MSMSSMRMPTTSRPHVRVSRLDVPGDGRLDLLALGEELIERHLADHVAERRPRILRDREPEVLDLDDRVRRALDLEEQDRVDADRHVVLGDDLLSRDLNRLDARVDQADLIDERHDEEQTRPLDAQELAETEHDRALPLCGEPDGRRDNEGRDTPASEECDANRRIRGCESEGEEDGGKKQNDEGQRRDVVRHGMRSRFCSRSFAILVPS